MKDYFRDKCRSHKSHRFFLMDEYYKLKDLRAFSEKSIHHKIWQAFLVKWQKLKI